jgi:phosphotransferase system  glucose/maltose/N-acetylglucosamine-specific IIC component
MYCYLISAVAHLFVVKSIAKQSKNFINVFMGSLGIKLMFFFAFIILFSFTHRSQAVPFLIWFMVYYLVFTTLDVVFLLIQNNQMNQAGKLP